MDRFVANVQLTTAEVLLSILHTHTHIYIYIYIIYIQMTCLISSYGCMYSIHRWYEWIFLPFCRWLFLELLGFVSFFGVLLVKGSSYLLELTICMLTVFTISLFCYILADMDEPFHGMFRMDISSLSDLLYTIQENHQQLTEDTAKQAVSVAVNVTDIVDAKE